MYHPVHVSVANIDYNGVEEDVFISLRVDKNDLNLAVYHNFEDTLHLVAQEMDSIDIRHVSNYLSACFYIKINDTIPMEMKMSGYMFKKEEIWFDFCSKINAPLEKMEVYNAIFTDLYFDQQNLVIFNGAGIQKGMYFDYQDRIKQLEIKLNDEGSL